MAIVRRKTSPAGDGIGGEVAVVTLSAQGVCVARRLGSGRLYVHEAVRGRLQAERFGSIIALTRRLFQQSRQLVFIAPCGVAVRAIAPLIAHKRTDPAVVVVDVGGRYAISPVSR